jgi:hypothetical protein
MKTFAILTTALALGTGIGMSQPGPGWHPGGPPGRGHHLFDPILMALDTNTNGVIEAEELANAPTALLKLDKNGDGKLTADELRPPMPPGTNQFRMRPPPPGGHPPVSPLMAALDTNGDGELDATEIANATTSLLKLDANGDGQLTPDEFRPKRPDGSGGPDRVGTAHQSNGPGGPEDLAVPPGQDGSGPGDLPPPDEPSLPGEPPPGDDR